MKIQGSIYFISRAGSRHIKLQLGESKKVMRLSFKGKYGLAAMIYLGEKENSPDPVTIAIISGELNISKIYLEQIFSLLKT